MPATMHVPVRLRAISPRVALVLVIAIGFLALSALVYLSDARTIRASTFAGAEEVGNVAYLSPSGASAAAATTSGTPTQEMHVANDGLTYLQSARVEVISGNDITVSIVWGSMNFLWTVQTSSATKFLDDNGNDESAANIVPGEYVTITGQLDPLENSPTIDAQFIRAA